MAEKIKENGENGENETVVNDGKSGKTRTKEELYRWRKYRDEKDKK